MYIIKSISLIFAFAINQTTLYAQTIDEYVTAAENNFLWMNGNRAIMKPVVDLNDHKLIFQEAFQNMSLDEGRPDIKDVVIIESKTVLIHKNKYHFIRYLWKGKERKLEIDLTPISEGEWKGMWSTR